ncbi:MAG: hypothetical protein HEQ23_14615 [Tepidisphaera sp.]|jgi:hypothetical protein
MAVQRGSGPGRNDLSGSKGQKQRSDRAAKPSGSRVEPSHTKAQGKSGAGKVSKKSGKK